MITAADIIDALNSRAGPQSRLRAAARVSWNAWLDRWAQKPGRVTGAPVDDMVAILAARELASPPARAIALNRWQAFSTLWRQHWHPASRDERSWRWIAGGVDVVWHVFLLIMLLIITALHVVEPTADEDDNAVQVEFIGRGTPAEEGGGPAPSPAETQDQSSPSSAAAAQPQAAAPAAQSQASASSAEAVASASQSMQSVDMSKPVPSDETPTSPAATPPQPVQVSKAVSAEPPTFTLPPTSLPTQTVETQRAEVPEVRAVTIPDLARAPELNVPTPRIEVQPVEAITPSVVTRDIPEAVRLPSVTAPTTTRVETPRAAVQSVDVTARDIPDRAAASPASSTASTAAPTSAAPASTGAQPSRAPGTATNANAASATARAAGTSPGAAAAGPTAGNPSAGVGAGPKATPAPGSWATPTRGDDWGESDRNRPGNSLYDSNGRPRLAEGPGSASAGHPPGMITQEIKDLDRAGTWLKRKPNPYEPTRWDRVWRPNGTLLEEWVDKGVKQVGIPIPGTNKRIVCIISILQFGGGCDISDPNLNEQPATARPPPDVPFKPALQENNGATWDKDGKAPPPPPLPGLFAPPKSGVPPGTTTSDDE